MVNVALLPENAAETKSLGEILAEDQNGACACGGWQTKQGSTSQDKGARRKPCQARNSIRCRSHWCILLWTRIEVIWRPREGPLLTPS